MYSVCRCGHRGAEAPASVVHLMTYDYMTRDATLSIRAALVDFCGFESKRGRGFNRKQNESLK